MKFVAIFFLLIFLSGCVDQKGTINQNTKDDIKEILREALQGLPKPEINVPPNQQIDTGELKREILASSNNTASQMTGALNLSVSKLADQFKAIEANIGKLLEINNSLTVGLKSDVKANATAIAEFRLILQNTINLSSEIRASMQAIANVQNEMKADIKVMNQMSAELKLNASAIAGIGNRLENLNQNLAAGRDVNYLPKEAVEMVALLVGAVVLIAALVVYLFHNSSMQAMRLEAEKQTDERKRLNQLLMRAMAVLPLNESGESTDRSFSQGTEVQSLMKDIKQVLQ